MAYPTAVNNQITDAVTQANVKVLGDAPAMAMSMVYQSMAQSLSLAMQNAVLAQQQMNVTLQAATTEGASTLYAALSGSQAAAPMTSASAAAAASSASDAITTAATATAGTGAVMSAVPHSAPASGAVEQIEQAVQFVDKLVLGASDDVAQAVQKVLSAFTGALNELAVLAEGQAQAVVRTAASASCWAAMIRSPESAPLYENVLNSIRNS